MSAGDNGADPPLLAGIRVLEWADGTAAGYAARLLRNLGADVARLERRAPVDRDLETFLDVGKTVVDANPGRDGLLSILADVDILLDDHAAGARAALGLDAAALAVRFPTLVQVAVTPFGQTGPYRDWRATDVELACMAGLAHLTPRDVSAPPGSTVPPLKMPGALVSMYAGASAAGAALAALLARQDGGPGRVVDVSMLESLIPTLRREIALYEYQGVIASRFMRVWRLAPWGVKPCRDGYVFLQVVERHHWAGLVEMMGSPAWALDPRFEDAEYRYAHRAAIETSMHAWLMTQDKASFGWESQRRNLPFAPVNGMADVCRIPQLQARGFWRAALAPDGRPCVVPGSPFRFRTQQTAAPAATAGHGVTAAASASLPLAGIKVVDFGHVWAGPYCAALLADMGADVVKVESEQRLDVHRRQGPYPDGIPGINRSGVWNAQNRGKRSVTLNLATEGGRDLARRLVAQADVVIENFAPGVMQRLGLDYAALAQDNPGLVMASLSAFGQQGPQCGYVGYGPSLDAWAGLDAQTAFADGSPNALGGVFPDTGSALHAAVAILAALHARKRSGAGCYVDLSELEVSVLMVGDLATRALAGGEVAPTGNAGGDHFPQGVFRCAGDDAWLAVSVVDDTSWAGLCDVVGAPAWKGDPELATVAGRRRAAPQLETRIGAWCATRNAIAAMGELQRAGVPAGAVYNVPQLLSDVQLAARGYFETVHNAETGAQRVYGALWRFDGNPVPINGPAPTLGQSNREVLARLGLGDEHVRALHAARVVY
ncbi:MAG: CoA transferase [Proteobacteria bacterium]|nr:CoA transferase [Pseudomonadota bacterium]